MQRPKEVSANEYKRTFTKHDTFSICTSKYLTHQILLLNAVQTGKMKKTGSQSPF